MAMPEKGLTREPRLFHLARSYPSLEARTHHQARLPHHRLPHGDGWHGLFPKLRADIQESGLDRSTVIRHVQKAVETGFLAVTSRLDKEGDQTSNLYRPIMPEVVAQNDHPVADDNQGSRTQRPRVVAQRDPNYPSELPIEHTKCVRFEDYWVLVPNKLDRKGCERVWIRDRLDAVADEVIAGLKRWKASEQWQNARYIPHPSTFLNQERWKSEPPAAEPKPLAKGEVRVRESTPAEKAEAAERARFFEVMKANPGKSESEISAIIAAERRAA